MTRTTGPADRPRRSGRVGATLLLGLAMAMGSAPASVADWTTSSTPGGSTEIPATTMPAGPAPTLALEGDDVTVSWAEVRTADDHPVDGYVLRRTEDGGSPLPADGGCAAVVASLSCVDTGVPEGRWTWSVQPRLGENWSGPSSASSLELLVDVSAPVNLLTAVQSGGAAVIIGTTAWYRGAEAGSFRVRNDLVDAVSGPASSSTTALVGDSTGFSHSPSQVADPAGGPYVSSPVAWQAGTTATATLDVVGRDVSGNLTTTTLTLTDDSQPPVGGSLTSPAGSLSGLTATLSWPRFTDAGSGVATLVLQRQLAALGGDGTCGSYGSWRTRASLDVADTSASDTLPTTACARYRLVATDAVGNVTVVVSGSVTRTGYEPTLSSSASLVGRWRLGERELVTTDVSDDFSGTSGQLLEDYDAAWVRNDPAHQLRISSSGTVYRASDPRATYLHSPALPTADYTVAADITRRSAIAGEFAGVRARSVGNTGYLALYNAPGNVLQLYRRDPGAFVLLGDSPLTLANGSTRRLALEVSGSSIRLLIDGTPVISATDATYTAAGQAGLSYETNGSATAATSTTGVHLDDVTVTRPTPAVDSAGSNDGTYVGAPTLGVSGALVGSSDTAVSFDGVDDHVRIDNPVSDDFSIEFWFRAAPGAGTGPGDGWWQGTGLVDAAISGSTTDFGVTLSADGSVVAGVGSPDTSIGSALGYDDDTWHHVVFTRTASTGALALYVDGVLADALSSGPTAPMTSPTISFARVDEDREYLTGSIDEVSIYSSVLTAQQVEDRWQTGTATPADLAGPTGGGIAVLGLAGTGGRYATSTDLSIAFSSGSDPSGLSASRTLARTEAPLSDGTCGTYGPETILASDVVDAQSPFADVVDPGRCYVYSLTVEDTEGNLTTYVSGAVKVDVSAPTAPTVSATAGTASTVLASPTRVVYNPTVPGTFSLTGAGADPESGVAEWLFPSLGSGWTGGGSQPGPTATYAWAASPVAPAGATLSYTGNQGSASPSSPSLSILPDATAPSGGSVSVVEGVTHQTDVPVTHAAGTDDLAGIGARTLQRAVAGYSGGTCGTFGSFAAVAGGSPPTGPPHVDAVTQDACYRYRYVVADLVGNVVTYGPTGVLRALRYYRDQVAGSVPVGYWRLGDATTATSARDSLGTRNGTYYGSPTRGAAGALREDSDTATTFDGVDDVIAIARPVASSFSIELWFKSTQTNGGSSTSWTGNARLVDATEASHDGFSHDFGLSLRSSDGAVVAGVSYIGEDVITSSRKGLNDGAWHHVVFTRNAPTGALRLYVDGVLSGSATGDDHPLDDSPVMAFGGSSTGTNLFAGSLDEIAVFNRALTASEIATHVDSR